MRQFSYLFMGLFCSFLWGNTLALSQPLETDYTQFLELKEIHSHGQKDFTEGLFFDNDKLYESTGIEGTSFFKQIYPTKKIIHKLPDNEFGEGSVLFKGDVYFLTYQNHKAYRYGKQNKVYDYPYEGWGLTTDGTYLISSDGSAFLHFFDENLKEVKKLKITLAGKELKDLNELEVIDGLIWANIWKTNKIAVINPKTGEVILILNFDSLIKKYQLDIPDNTQVDVFNGIAFNPITKTIWLTGKYYPILFEMKQIKTVAK